MTRLGSELVMQIMLGTESAFCTRPSDEKDPPNDVQNYCLVTFWMFGIFCKRRSALWRGVWVDSVNDTERPGDQNRPIANPLLLIILLSAAVDNRLETSSTTIGIHHSFCRIEIFVLYLNTHGGDGARGKVHKMYSYNIHMFRRTPWWSIKPYSTAQRNHSVSKFIMGLQRRDVR